MKMLESKQTLFNGLENKQAKTRLILSRSRTLISVPFPTSKAKVVQGRARSPSDALFASLIFIASEKSEVFTMYAKAMIKTWEPACRR